MNDKEILNNFINMLAEKTGDKRITVMQKHSELYDNLQIILENMTLANEDYMESTYNLFEQFNKICESYIIENKIDVKKLKNMFGE